MPKDVLFLGGTHGIVAELSDIGAGSGTDEVLLIPIANKTIPANTSMVVADHYRLDSAIGLTIESGANLTII